MTIGNLARCWDADFPGDPLDRLVAIAVADGMDSKALYTTNFVRSIAAKTGLTVDEVTDRLDRLARQGVIVQVGPVLEWIL